MANLPTPDWYLQSATSDSDTDSTQFRHKSKRDPEENCGSTKRISNCHEDPSSRSAGMKHRHRQSTKVVPLLRPGSFVTLENQPDDLPPFELIQCRGGRCWVRQQAWGQSVQWEVEHERLRTA